MLAGVDVLIIEDEALIALDIELLVEESGGRSLTLPSLREAVLLRDRWASYKLAIINPPNADLAEEVIARAMQDAGIRLVLNSADRYYHPGSWSPQPIPLVVKPFTETELLAACRQALAH